MMTGRCVCALLVLGLLGSAPSRSAPPNDTDIDVLALTSRWTPNGVGPIDAESDGIGRMYVALVEFGRNLLGNNFYTLQVWVRDHANLASWTELMRLPLPSASGDAPLSLHLTTAGWVDGATSPRHGHLVVSYRIAARGVTEVAYFTGQPTAPWTVFPGGWSSHVIFSGQPFDLSSGRAALPSIAVIPRAPSDFTNKMVAVAVSDYDVVAVRNDLKLIEITGQAMNRWTTTTTRITGPNSPSGWPSDAFHPFLAADAVNGYGVLAFHDGGIPSRTRVYSFTPTSPPQFSWIADTPVGEACQRPQVKIQQAKLTMTCLGEKHASFADGYRLKWFGGSSVPLTPLISFGALYEACRSVGDLDLRRNDVYITADCYRGRFNGHSVMAWEGNRETGAMTRSAVSVNDWAIAGSSPRAVCKPPGAAAPLYYDYVYNGSNAERFPPPIVYTGSLYVDPTP